MFCWTPSVSSSPDIDFLMKYIIIGAAFNVTVLVHEFKALFQAKQGQENPAYCTISHIIHVGPESRSKLHRTHVGLVKDHSQHTIGVEFSSRTVKLGEKRIKLQVSFLITMLWLSVSLTQLVVWSSSFGIQLDKSASGAVDVPSDAVSLLMKQIGYSELLSGSCRSNPSL